MLAVVLNREMVRERRLIVYRILGDDRPGMLSAMSAVIGGLGGNIIDVVHNRLALDVPAKGAEFEAVFADQAAGVRASAAVAAASVGPVKVWRSPVSGSSTSISTCCGVVMACAPSWVRWRPVRSAGTG